MSNSQLLVILTERDIVKLTAQELVFEKAIVAEVMTQPVVTLLQDNFKDIFAALFLFRRYRIRHLPLGQLGSFGRSYLPRNHSSSHATSKFTQASAGSRCNE